MSRTDGAPANRWSAAQRASSALAALDKAPRIPLLPRVKKTPKICSSTHLPINFKWLLWLIANTELSKV